MSNRNYYFIFHRNKYHNQKITYNGEKFDSVMELAYYKYLLDLKEKGEVKKITRQPSFTLIEGFKYDGKTYRKRVYTPDFLVEYEDGHKEIVEVKGYADTAYKLRKALFLKKYIVNKPNIKFVEIKRKDMNLIDSGLKSGQLEEAIKKEEGKKHARKRKNKASV